jgi:hypothetical protein
VSTVSDMMASHINVRHPGLMHVIVLRSTCASLLHEESCCGLEDFDADDGQAARGHMVATI